MLHVVPHLYVVYSSVSLVETLVEKSSVLCSVVELEDVTCISCPLRAIEIHGWYCALPVLICLDSMLASLLLRTVLPGGSHWPCHMLGSILRGLGSCMM